MVRWTDSGGGSFDDASNWDAGSPPDNEQVAVFDNSAGYAVQFGGASRQSRRIQVRQGDVDLVSGQWEILEESGAEPSITVATGARLDVDGHVLTGTYATVGDSPAASVGPGVIGVQGVNSGLLLNARLIVGRAGRGQLSVNAGGSVISAASRIGDSVGGEGVAILDNVSAPSDVSEWDTGNLAVGYFGRGELRVLNASEVQSESAYVATLSGSEGEVLVSDNGEWRVSQDLGVGASGQGALTVSQVATVEVGRDLSVGTNTNGFGEIRVTDGAAVDGIAARSELIVGRDIYLGVNGIGIVSIESGAKVTAETLQMGFSSGSDGDLTVRGAAGTTPEQFSVLEMSDGLIVGVDGSGFALEDRASVVSSYGVIGAAAQGDGTVTIRNDAGWDLGGDLNVGTASQGSDPNICDGDEVAFGVGTLQLLGDGQMPDVTGQTLTVTGPNSSVTGIGRASFTNTVITHCGQIAPGNSPGTLTLDGDLALGGGILEIEMAGVSSGEFDALVVTGNADLSGTIVRFVFTGFLPQQGDQITFLEAGGSVSQDENTRFEYVGANDGFEFSIDVDDNGNVTFTADNDAVDQLFANGFE